MNAAYLACGGWVAAVVGETARLGLADHVADEALTADALAARTGAAPAVLARMLTVLVQVGLFTVENGRYRTTTEGARLCEDHPDSTRWFCQLAAGDYQRIFTALSHTSLTGAPAAPAALGATLYDHLARDPHAAHVYDRAMEDLARQASRVLATSRDFTGVRTIVDVGGGRGTLLIGLLRALPQASGAVVDRPDTCARAAAALSEVAPELAGRLTFAPGDFFDAVPSAADRYLLKNVLHNWGDADAARLLRVIGGAMAPGARLLVIDAVEDGMLPPMYRALDSLMQMVVSSEGNVPRTADQLAALVAAAGFTVVDRAWLPSGHLVLEAAPAREARVPEPEAV